MNESIINLQKINNDPRKAGSVYSDPYAFKETNNKKLIRYVRKVLLQKPFIIQYRDGSSDEILAALNRLSRELSAIGNNFNQTAHKVHTLDDFPEIKVWAEMTESSRQNLLRKVDEIRQFFKRNQTAMCPQITLPTSLSRSTLIS